MLFCNLYLINAQTIYTEKQLTGRGDLPLIGETYKLQPEVYKAYNLMKDAALKEGISIKMVSAYRSYNYQTSIVNRKYAKYLKQGISSSEIIKKIITYSALPGTSRHHWGTDVDLIDETVICNRNVLNPKNFQNNGCYEKLKIWLDQNSEKFGFYLVYTDSINREGFKYEPWHYSYKKIAKPMLLQFLQIDKKIIYDNRNFKGNKFLNIEFLEAYYKKQILDINSELY